MNRKEVLPEASALDFSSTWNNGIFPPGKLTEFSIPNLYAFIKMMYIRDHGSIHYA